jgi:probable rRNA maturation factor
MISFTNLTKKPIQTAVFTRLYKNIFSARSNFELSVVFAGPALMRKLNKTHRKKDKIANVLSFLLEKGSSDARKAKSGYQRGVGEVFINRNEKDLSHLFVHGCLHLLGYDHINDTEASLMEKKERDILKR